MRPARAPLLDDSVRLGEPSKNGPDAVNQALIARQPIVDTSVAVRGYELLFRRAELQESDGFDGEIATATVAINTLLDLGLDTVAGEHPVFINLTRSFLVRELYLALPPERVVLEVLETIEPEADVLAALARARALGYSIALDDYLHHERLRPLLDQADIVKVDVKDLSQAELGRQVEILRRPGLLLLAEKVETHERFALCREAGYDLFQGWFYARPDLVKRQTARPDRMALVQLLGALEDPSIGFDQIGELVEQSLLLSHKLLRFVNSTLFALPDKIESIRHACAVLGLARVRVCVTLLLLSELDEKPGELLLNALTRARLCQLLSPWPSGTSQQKHFTVGLFSLLDAYLDCPIEELLQELPFSDDVKRALLAGEGDSGSALRTAIACERADWDALQAGPRDPGEVQRLHLAALDWTRGVIRSIQSEPG